MVIVGKEREREVGKKSLMEMGPDRSSKPLHNFTMPCLKWGSQRFLRCVKVNSNGEVSAAEQRSSASEADRNLIGRQREAVLERYGSSHRTESLKVSPAPAVGVLGWKSRPEIDGNEGIEAVRAKLMFDLQTAADKMKDAILREGLEKEPPATVAAAEAEAVRPWNLRTRRAACKAPNGGISAGDGGGGVSNGAGKSLNLVDVLKPNFSPVRTDNKSSRLQGSVVASLSGEKRDRAKFSVPLCRREIEEDYAIFGLRPPRRPKKRARVVQKQLDTLFPGLWLTEVNADLYKVPEAPETGKW